MKAVRERRACPRFPIEQSVRYKQISADAVLEGVGMTLNMSRDGILFTTEQALSPDTHAIVEVSWPVLLEGRTPLKLVVRGCTVWCDEAKAAIRIQHHEFHTKATQGLSQFATSNHQPKKPIVQAVEAKQEWPEKRRRGR